MCAHAHHAMRAAAAAKAETEIASKSRAVESGVRFRLESRVKTTAYVGPITAEDVRTALATTKPSAANQLERHARWSAQFGQTG